MGKQAMQYFHWTPDQYGEADYFQLQEFLNAEKPEEFNQDPFAN